ncbi:MAG: ABC transporter ATP-binding protein [Oscillospiraceae bacterium]|nr:ABC transporter ATP-binding protein [Oscillospiraceae bacterium]
MRKLLKYFNGYKIEALCAPFFKIIEAIFELFVPFVVAAIIDKGIPSGDKGYITAMCGVLVLLGAVGLTSTLAAQYFAAKSAVGFATSLRQALFDHIQSLGFAEIDRTGTSTLITRLTSDLNQVQTGVNLTLRLLMRSPFIVFGAMIMAFTIDVQAALVFVVVIPLLSVVVFGIMLACIPLYSKVQARLDKVLSITRENLTGARVIRAFCKEDEETAEFTSRNEALTRIQQFVGRISAIMNPVTVVIVNLGIIALIYIGALKVETGLLTQGMVIALYNYMSQILVELVKLANLIINITKSLACAKRIEKVLEITPEMADGTITKGNDSSEYIAEYKNVSFKYPDASADSLENISFILKRGENVGIIGSTGCGKSTLVNLLPRFYDTTEGEVLVDGVNVKDYSQVALRDKIGFVMQKTVLFKGSIKDNLRWGKEDATEEEMIKALTQAQAIDFVTAKPEGLDYKIEQNARNLSGGQAQRLSIARALVKRPEILVLDDSSSALDYATDAKLRASIRELDYSPAVLVVSQRVASVMHCDKIIVLEDGLMAGMGTHDELLKSCEEYREIYDSQIKS